MELTLHKKYKNKDIYVDINTGYYIVYKDGGNEIAREAIHRSVQNNIDVNVPIFAHRMSETLLNNDIDVEDIFLRSDDYKQGYKEYGKTQ